uniref:Reverse transcriptase domain-containing protein n=1 Tax=Tanacetum cinerariifolium TaxID=118510 RepID=A0A6L2LT40_TANCI|nr:reverse transcriptase domain-containing protein [Tanacetum cinerariifolium]
MTRLLEKDSPFIFSKECVEALQTLKRKLTEAPILIAQDWDMPFELMCDASDFAIGAVLGQRQDKHFRPIHYASKTMTEAKSNYTTTEKEMLAVVYAFEKFRSYLIINKSIVYMDHSALKYLFAKKDLKARLLSGDHRKVQINELNEFRDQAYKNSMIYKEKTKRLHDLKIKNRVFNIGDRVLLFNSRLKIFLGKLNSRWSGPFTISQVYPYGTLELSQPDGPNFKVNGHRLKHYFGDDIPKAYSRNLKTHDKGFCPPVFISSASLGNQKQEEKRIEEEQAANAQYWKIPACCDGDDDYNSAITPILSIEETDNSLSMGDEHLDTISAMESDEVIKSSVEDLVPIPSESEGIPDTMCDVHLVNNPTPLEAKDHIKIVINSNDDISSSDDDSPYNENIEYVEASPHDSEVVSLEVAEIVIPEEEEIEDDNLRENLLNVHLLIANIEALKDNPTPSSEFLTKSSSTSPKSFLEETNTFHNPLPEFENFYFDLEEISSGSPTTHSDISLPDYEAFYFDDDHIKEISSGSTTTHSNISLSEYDSFIFDLSNNQFPPTDRSDFTHEEFADRLAHIIFPPKYDCFYFRNLPDPGKWIPILNFGIRENLSFTTRVNLLIKGDHSPLLAYVVWIFLAYLTYPVIPLYLHSFRNEDTIFDPGITINRFYSFKSGLSHRCGTSKKFNTRRSHLNESLMEMLFSTCFPMDQ